MRDTIKFLPALFFLYIWISLLHYGSDMKTAITHPINSETFIHTFGRSIDNPWTHNSALRLYFKKLLNDRAKPQIWIGSRPYAWELWQQYQYDGSLEILLAIAHQANNSIDEIYWANQYANTHPDSQQADYYMQHAKTGHYQRKPLKLVGRW